MNNSYVLKNINVIPMDDERILQNMDALISDGIIQKIESSKDDWEVKTINCTEKFLIPGLHDCHVHIGCADDLLTLLGYGVTTDINLMGTDSHLKWKDAIKNKEQLGADLYTSGPICDKTS